MLENIVETIKINHFVVLFDFCDAEALCAGREIDDSFILME